MFYLPNGPAVHTLSQSVVEKAVHHMAEGHIPRHIRDRNLSRVQAGSMVFFMINLGLSFPWKLIATFIGGAAKSLFASTVGKHINGVLLETIFFQGDVTFGPPYSRPWIKRLTLINYIDVSAVRTRLPIECLEELHTRVMTVPLSSVH